MNNDSTSPALSECAVRFRGLLTLIPDTTSAARARELLDRYRDLGDGTVAALPPLYRGAMQARLLHLISAAPGCDSRVTA